jgi:hypothetical protein
MVKINSLSEPSGCLPIAGKSDGDDGIAGKDVREKQRICENEENKGTEKRVSFRIYEDAGFTRCRNLK